MSDWRKRLVLRIIHENGGRLVRQKRHLVFRFPDGRKFVVPKTPSDLRAWRNSLSILMRLLGVRKGQPRVIRRDGNPNSVPLSNGQPELAPKRKHANDPVSGVL